MCRVAARICRRQSVRRWAVLEDRDVGSAMVSRGLWKCGVRPDDVGDLFLWAALDVCLEVRRDVLAWDGAVHLACRHASRRRP